MGLQETEFLSDRGKFQWNIDYGETNLVRVSGKFEFELIDKWLKSGVKSKAVELSSS